MYFLKIQEIVYALLKAMNLNYDRKAWKRVIDNKTITTKEKQKHITNGMQRILKIFYNHSKKEEYIFLYKIYHSYINIYETITHQKTEDKGKVIFSVIVNVIIPSIVIFLKLFKSTIDLKLFLPQEKSIIYNIIKLYMKENNIDSYEDLANSIDGSYQGNLKQIQRIKIYKNIPKNNGFYKYFGKEYEKIFIIAAALESFYQISNEYFGKKITDDFKDHFLDLYSKEIETFYEFRTLNETSYQEVYIGAITYLMVTFNSEHICDNIIETITKSKDKLTIVKEWDELVPIKNASANAKIINELIALCELQPKDEKIKSKIEKLLKILEDKTEDKMFYDLFLARHLFFDKEFEKSIHYYEKAIEQFQYQHQDNFISIVEEFLTLLAYMKKKQKFYKYYEILTTQKEMIMNREVYYNTKQFEALYYNKDTFYEYFINDINPMEIINLTAIQNPPKLICLISKKDLKGLEKELKKHPENIDKDYMGSHILYGLLSLLDKNIPEMVYTLFPSSKDIIFKQIELFIKYGANINFTQITGHNPNEKWEYTPLMYACELGYNNVIELFVKNGADVNFKSTAGLTAKDILTTHNPDLIQWYDEIIKTIK